MSLLSAIIIPKLEEELAEQEPAIAAFMVKQAHGLAMDVIAWAEKKMQPQEPAE